MGVSLCAQRSDENPSRVSPPSQRLTGESRDPETARSAARATARPPSLRFPGESRDPNFSRPPLPRFQQPPHHLRFPGLPCVSPAKAGAQSLWTPTCVGETPVMDLWAHGTHFLDAPQRSGKPDRLRAVKKPTLKTLGTSRKPISNSRKRHACATRSRRWGSRGKEANQISYLRPYTIRKYLFIKFVEEQFQSHNTSCWIFFLDPVKTISKKLPRVRNIYKFSANGKSKFILNYYP